MRLIIILSAIILLTGCNHYKYFVRHQDELCQLCPKSDSTVIQYRDTVVYLPAINDTTGFFDFDFSLDSASHTVTTDNGTVEAIKWNDKLRVIYRSIPVPVAIPQTYIREVRTVTVDKPVEVCRNWWKWLIGGFVLAVILAVVWRVSKRV